ncbi:MAG: hypothetical protein WB567_13405 [Terracidiphilus sp.]
MNLPAFDAVGRHWVALDEILAARFAWRSRFSFHVLIPIRLTFKSTRLRQNFSKVQSLPMGKLLDLFPAAEAIGHHDRACAGRLNSR